MAATRNRIPLGGESIRSTAGVSSRSGSSADHRSCCDNYSCDADSKGGDDDDSDCVLDWQRPVEVGLVASLIRPGGNMTGVANLSVEVGAKQLELLHLLVPTVAVIALLVSPNDPILAAFSLFSCGP